MKKYPRWLLGGFLAAALLVSLGWTSTSVRRLYDGAPLPADKIAKVSADANITVYSADWKEFNTFTLVGDSTTELQFLPGPHAIVARYCAIWNVGPGDSDNATVMSAYLTLRFAAEAGHAYRIAYPNLKTVDQAKTFARQPDLWIEDVQTQARLEQLPESAFAKAAPAQPPTAPAPAAASPVAAAAPAPAVAPVPPAAPAKAAPAAEEVSSLQLLKFGWQKATPAEREAFREWLKQNPGP